MRYLMAILLLCGSVYADAGASSTAQPELAAKLESLASLRARFTQQQIAADGFELRTTAGELCVQRPGRMRWISEPPYEQWVISNGVRLWVYDPDLEQVTIRNFESDIANSPVMLLTGDVASVAGSHDISLDKDGHTFVLTPRAANAAYERITLSFDGTKPSRIALTDSLGEQTVITFSQVEINPSLDLSLFEFAPPAGVDVISQ